MYLKGEYLKHWILTKSNKKKRIPMKWETRFYLNYFILSFFFKITNFGFFKKVKLKKNKPKFISNQSSVTVSSRLFSFELSFTLGSNENDAQRRKLHLDIHKKFESSQRRVWQRRILLSKWVLSIFSCNCFNYQQATRTFQTHLKVTEMAIGKSMATLIGGKLTAVDELVSGIMDVL